MVKYEDHPQIYHIGSEGDTRSFFLRFQHYSFDKAKFQYPSFNSFWTTNHTDMRIVPVGSSGKIPVNFRFLKLRHGYRTFEGWFYWEAFGLNQRGKIEVAASN